MNIEREQTASIDVTPQEAARIFMHGDTHDQVAFLNECGRLASEPNGPHTIAWFEFQLESVRRDEGVLKISDDAAGVLCHLYDYLGKATSTENGS